MSLENAFVADFIGDRQYRRCQDGDDKLVEIDGHVFNVLMAGKMDLMSVSLSMR